MQVNAPVELTRSSGEAFRGHCRDLSTAGMQVFMEQAVAVGAELTAVLYSAGEPFPPLETVCEVVRCQPEGDGFLAGLSILEVIQ